MTKRKKKPPFVSTSISWDNFYINLEKHSGKDSIHHTYRICYQKMQLVILIPKPNFHLKKNWKRRFSKVSEPTEIEIESYRKNKKINLQFDFQVIDVPQPSSYSLGISYDTLWMIASNLLPLVPSGQARIQLNLITKCNSQSSICVIYNCHQQETMW